MIKLFKLAFSIAGSYAFFELSRLIFLCLDYYGALPIYILELIFIWFCWTVIQILIWDKAIRI